MKTAVEWLVEEIKIKADNLSTNTKENRIAKGVYVDCLLMARKAKEMDKQQQGYSEEEARIIWRAGQEYCKTSGDSITFEELTEKLKTKYPVKTKDRILSETSEETKQKARDYANSLITKLNMTSNRIKEIQSETAYPESRSVNQALLKVWNECEQESKQERMYSEEELLKFGKSCFYKGFSKSENDDANCYTAFREEIGSLFEQFKNK